jgi:hypothetical protein
LIVPRDLAILRKATGSSSVSHTFDVLRESLAICKRHDVSKPDVLQRNAADCGFSIHDSIDKPMTARSQTGAFKRALETGAL